MRIGVTISRDWDDYEAILGALDDLIYATPPWEVTIVHGASHMDWFIAGAARSLGMQLEAHRPDWEGLGRKAGPIRNEEMVDSGANVWLAFIKNGSRGATGCARLADEAGIPVRYWRR